MRPAVFFDRDDTLVPTRDLTARSPHPGDLFDPSLVEPFAGAGRAIADLHAQGYAVVVVSNQGAVARGNCTIDDVHATNRALADRLAEQAGTDRARPDAFYFCPYHPEGRRRGFAREHPWRKPAPGMVLAASADLHLDLAASWLVGDMERDIDSAIRAGIPPERTVLIEPTPDLCAIADRIIAGGV